MLSIRGIRWSAPYAAVFFARAAAAAQERITVPADSSAIHFSEGWHKVALVPRDPLIPLKAPWPPSVIQMANLSSASLSYTFTGSSISPIFCAVKTEVNMCAGQIAQHGAPFHALLPMFDIPDSDGDNVVHFTTPMELVWPQWGRSGTHAVLLRLAPNETIEKCRFWFAGFIITVEDGNTSPKTVTFLMIALQAAALVNVINVISRFIAYVM